MNNTKVETFIFSALDLPDFQDCSPAPTILHSDYGIGRLLGVDYWTSACDQRHIPHHLLCLCCGNDPAVAHYALTHGFQISFNHDDPAFDALKKLADQSDLTIYPQRAPFIDGDFGVPDKPHNTPNLHSGEKDR